MMDELSLNILDIAQNSIAAKATLVEIDILEDDAADSLVISVKDNGVGMTEDFLEIVQDPFVTTRTTRKFGLGISFFKEAAEITGGSLNLDSTPGVGTVITATFVKSHIDRQPIGDLTGTVIALVALNTAVDFYLRYKVNENEFVFSTVEVKEMLGDGADLSNPQVSAFLTEYLNEHIESLHTPGLK